MYGAYILAQYAEKEKLHGEHKEQAYHYWRHAYGEPVPENQFIYQVKESYEKAGYGHYEPGEGGYSKRDLGIVGKAEHGHIV